MNTIALITVVVALATPLAVIAQSGDMKGMDMKDHKGMDMKSMSSDKGQDRAHKATGTVTKIDSAKNAVTIAHGPVPSMKWPAMTMTFGVKDKVMLDKLTTGKKVEVEFVQQGKDYVITDVK
jgi:Cu(I)/Ag(I) efflux system periplasmic protein CusF